MPSALSAAPTGRFHRACCAMLAAVYLLTTVGLPLAGAFSGVAPRCGCSLDLQQEKACCCCNGKPNAGQPVVVRSCCRKDLDQSAAGQNVTADSVAVSPSSGSSDPADNPARCCRLPAKVTSAAVAVAGDEQPVHAELRSCNCQLRPRGDIGLNAEPRLAGTRPQLMVLPFCSRLRAAASLFASRSIAPETPPPRV